MSGRLVIVTDETVAQVVEELDRDYLLSLAVTLTGRGAIAQKIAEWERGGRGDYLDISSFRLVAQVGPGRLHMRDVLDAADAGITTFLFGKGIQTLDKYPQVQYMLYSQWFTFRFTLCGRSSTVHVWRRRMALLEMGSPGRGST